MASEYDKQRHAAETYLKEKQIPELLSYLLELVAFEQPEDPREFLAKTVQELRNKNTTPKCLFGDDELETMFAMISVTKDKFISIDQLKHAYSNLGGSELPDSALSEEVRSSGKVYVETFKEVIGDRLRTKNVWAK